MLDPVNATASHLPPGPPQAPPTPSRAAHRPLPRQVRGLAQLAALIERELGQARRDGARLALMLVDAEALDAQGQRPAAVPPALWQAAALRLAQRVRSTDLVLRVDQSSFALLLQGAGRREAEVVRANLARGLAGPYAVEGASFGLALHTGVGVLDDSSSGSELVAAAQIQMLGELG